MDFAIFSKTEVEEMFQTMIEHMPENIKIGIIGIWP